MKSDPFAQCTSTLAALLVALAASTTLAQWTGPTGAQNRIDYVTGNAYVGTAGFPNSVVRFDVVDMADTGRTISFHAFAGTPNPVVRTTAIWGETNNPQGRALQGFNFATTGTGAGIWAENASASGFGLRARATSTTGLPIAGYFDNASASGYAIYADATNASGNPVAIWGNTASATGWAGYFTGGRSYFQYNVGVGTPQPTHPLHVVGDDSQGAVFATNSSNAGGANTGGVAGVRGTVTLLSASSWSAGVWGINNSTNTAGIGIAGFHAGAGYGVYGRTGDSAGFAGYFSGKVNVSTSLNVATDAVIGGNLAVTGSLSKGSGSFKIDHPLDPANKYLYHSFVESPDMMNIYNGTIHTDASGYAVVMMPDYFEALNRDFRYQLTIIDETDSGFAIAKVVREIQAGEFTIRTSLPNQKVSWQVTGIRHDAFAEKNRIPGTVDKADADKGLYLHPAAFGLPETLSISAAHAPREPAADAVANPKSASQAALPATKLPVQPAGVHEPALVPAIQSRR